MSNARRGPGRRWLWVGLALLVGVTLTSIVAITVLRFEMHDRDDRFQREATRHLDALETVLSVGLEKVETLGLFLEEPCGRSSFQRFASSLRAHGAGIRSLDWVPAVSAAQRADFERQARSEGLAGFEFTESASSGALVRARERARYYPVYFIEPQAGNERVPGFDLGSEAVRLATLGEAGRSGRLAVSPRLVEWFGSTQSYGFVAVRPVYRKNRSFGNAEERWQAVDGFAVGAFRFEDVVQAAATHLSPGVSLALFDCEAAAGSRLLYPQGSPFEAVGDLPPGSRALRRIAVGDRSWEAVAYSGSHPVALDRSVSGLVLVVGLLLSGALALYVRREMTRRHAIEAVVEKRTEELHSAFDGLAASKREREESETRCRRLVEISTEPILIAQDFKVTLANQAAISLLRAPAAEGLVGKTLLDLFDPDPPSLPQAVALALSGEACVPSVSGRMRCLDGTRPEVEAAVVSLVEGGTVTVQAVIRDVSERRRADAAMADARERAEAANQAKGQFLANVSHEIRTPLNGVLGMTQLLLRSDLAPEQRRYASMVRSSAESLLGVVNDILDFSNIEAHKVALEVVDFELHALLREAVETAVLKAHEKGLEITTHVMPGTPVVLRGDHARLRRVLAILVGNATKFSQHGEIGVRVRLQSEEPEGVTLHFSVSDRGIGIPQEKMDTLFSPFVQVDGSSTRRFGGTGLGLAISRHLVELMGGRIGATSQEGRGSTFWFTAGLGRGVGAPEAVAALPSLQGRRVLVADAQGGNRALLKKLLERWECTCETATSGEEALGALQRAAATGKSFDVALLDAGLPDLDGRALGRKVAEEGGPGAPRLLLMSYFSLGDEPDAADKHVFSAFVTKPVSEPLLLGALVGALDARQGSVGSGAAADGRESEWRGKRILVAEDNLTNAEVTRTMLSQFGCEVDTVANGHEAVEAMKRAGYDLILMDCEMPVLDGYEATRLIRRGGGRGPEVPIVAITADALPQDRERCLQSGMTDYLAKPIRLADLGRLLERWLPAPPSPAEKETPPLSEVFDEQDLLARLMGKRAMALKLLAGFLQDIPTKISGLREVVERRDPPAVRMQAHALKGAAATISAPGLRQVAGEIEVAAGADDLERAAGLLPLLDERFDQLKAALKQGDLI